MKLNDLKESWNDKVDETDNQLDYTKVITSIEKDTTAFDKKIKRRDILEISIAVLLIPVWSWTLFHSASVMQSVGLLIAIAACILIPYKLIKAKQVDAPKDTSILAFLQVEKLKLENQKQLLESIVLWYISPIMIAIFLITAGGTVNDAGLPQITNKLAIYYGCCVLLVVGIYLLNKRAANKQITPLLDAVNKRIEELTALNDVSE